MNDDQHSGREPLDLLALGAAGALSDDEYRVLDELLAADPELAREYAELQTSAATLAEVSSEAPPPQLRASVLEAIRGVDQLPGVEPVAPPPVEHHRPSNVVPIHHRRWMVPATAAAAVVMLLVGGLIINRDADAPADRMAEVLNDDDAVTIVLDGSLSGLRLVASEREDAAVLTGSGLEPPDAGLVFQLWAIHDEQMVGMGTFMPASNGEVELFVEGAGDDAAWAVTVEPEGGSDQPTTDPVAFSPGLF
jgi:anti-sigma-K factor RskA